LITPFTGMRRPGPGFSKLFSKINGYWFKDGEDIMKFSSQDEIAMALFGLLLMFDPESQNVNPKFVNYIQDIWNDFERIYFPTATNKEKAEQWFKAMKYAIANRSETIDLHGIFKSFVYVYSSMGIGFNVPETEVVLGGNNYKVQLNYGVFPDVNGNYNSEILYWGGEPRPREIYGNYWTFHDPHTGNWWGVMENGRNSFNYDKIWDWLLNIK